MGMAWRCTFSALILACAVGSSLPAAEWVVAQDGSGSFRSIQGAVNASSYGDVVHVSPGVYDELVTLRDGVRVVGAGAAVTVIRHAYGFEEVVRIRSMGSGSLERVTVERSASVLPGPAVLADSAAATLIDCVVLGGQGAGVEAAGTAAALTLDRVSIADTLGCGVYARDGARIVLTDSRVESSTGSGVLVADGASVRAARSAVLGNGRCGIAVEGSGRLEVDGCDVRQNLEWGVLASASASVEVRGSALADNTLGGLHALDAATASIADSAVSGGGDGVVASGGARLEVEGLRIRNTAGDGLRVTDGAALAATGLYVEAAGRNGVVLDTAGDARVLRSTLVDNKGDALCVRAGRPSVTQSILAYNRGAAVSVDASQSPLAAVDLGYNVVWSNGQDYVGVTRPPTDLAAPPALIEVEGRPALLPGSPCIAAGPAWASIGAGDDAGSLAMLALDFAPRLDGLLGATWTSTIRVGGLPVALETVGIGCHWLGETGRLDIDASVVGAWGTRIAGHAEGGLRWAAPAGGSNARVTYGADACLERARSWASAWVGGELEGAGLHTEGRFALVWPQGPWTADATFGLAGPVPIRLSVGATQLSLRSLAASVAIDSTLADGRLRLDARVSLLPILEASAEATWTRATSAWQTRAVYRPTEEALALSAAVGDSRSRVEGRVRVVAAVPVGGELLLTVGGEVIRARGGVSIDAGGVRIRAGLDLALDGLLARPANEPPVPAFRSAPPDPEAGKPVRFLADGSADPDGELREIWWDFGDGAAAEGRAVDHTFAAAGSYDVILTISDDDGAAASLTQTIRIWPADTTPVAAFTAYPVSPNGVRLPRPLRSGDLVRLDAGGSSDRDGKIVEYSWDVRSDGTLDVTSNDPATTLGPFAAGSMPITLRVVDDSGRADAVMLVVVVDKSEPPLAEFTFAPSSPAVRDPIRFVDRSTDTDGSIVAREWDFGDGATSRDASPIHRYERVGRYTVTLRVEDNDNLSATTSRTLDVVAVPGIADVGDVWAVLIGISDYAEVRDLQFAAEDATAMARRLLDAGVAQDHIRLLLDRDGPQSALGGLEARRATLVNVREALGWLRRMAAPDDLVLIHFSGHGFQGADDDGDEQDGVDEFFILWDTLAAAKEDTALRDDEFGASLDRIESQHVVVFFDGCYSGGLSRSLPSSARPTTSTSDLFSDFSVEGRIVFSASSETQDAFESDELRHGIFTYYVLDGLGGSADANEDHRVTAWELYEYVARRVPERSLLEHAKRQNPQLLGEGDVRVLLAEAPAAPTADFGYRPNRPYAGGATTFVDQSAGGRRIVARSWRLGEDATSEDASPTHVYALPGEYSVELRVTREDGTETTARQKVLVDPAPSALSIDSASGAVVVSVGGDHGVSVGDRFATVGDLGAAQSVLEVIEVIDGRTCAARIVEGATPPQGSTFRPLPRD